MRLVTADKIMKIFQEDAQYVGDGMYSIWAPSKDDDTSRVYSRDTQILFVMFKDRFKNVDGKFDLDTVWEN